MFTICERDGMLITGLLEYKNCNRNKQTETRINSGSKNWNDFLQNMCQQKTQ